MGYHENPWYKPNGVPIEKDSYSDERDRGSARPVTRKRNGRHRCLNFSLLSPFVKR